MSAERLIWFAITFAARYEFALRGINTVGASRGDLPDVAAATVRNSGAGLQRAMQRRLKADSVTGRRHTGAVAARRWHGLSSDPLTLIGHVRGVARREAGLRSAERISSVARSAKVKPGFAADRAPNRGAHDLSRNRRYFGGPRANLRSQQSIPSRTPAGAERSGP
jgi:hypothetical protein